MRQFLAFVSILIVAAGCGTGSSAASPSQSLPTARIAPTAVDDAGAALCAALADLRQAQDLQVAPLLNDIGAADVGDLRPLKSANGIARLSVVATIFLRNRKAVDGAVFPGAPQLVVELKRAYAGYGLGITDLKNMADDPDAYWGQLVAPLQELADAQMHLEEAVDQSDIARARGTLTCP